MHKERLTMALLLGAAALVAALLLGAPTGVDAQARSYLTGTVRVGTAMPYTLIMPPAISDGYLRSNTTGQLRWDNSFSANWLSDGTVPIERLGTSGTRSATTVLAGDNGWVDLLTTDGLVKPSAMGSGTADDTTILYGDGVWRSAPPFLIGYGAQRDHCTGSGGINCSGRVTVDIDTAVKTGDLVHYHTYYWGYSSGLCTSGGVNAGNIIGRSYASGTIGTGTYTAVFDITPSGVLGSSVSHAGTYTMTADHPNLQVHRRFSGDRGTCGGVAAWSGLVITIER